MRTKLRPVPTCRHASEGMQQDLKKGDEIAYQMYNVFRYFATCYPYGNVHFNEL